MTPQELQGGLVVAELLSKFGFEVVGSRMRDRVVELKCEVEGVRYRMCLCRDEIECECEFQHVEGRPLL